MPYSSTNRRQPVIAPYVANSAGKQQQRELFAQQLQQQPAYGGASAISPNQPSNFYSDPSVRDAEVISPQRRQPVPLSDIGDVIDASVSGVNSFSQLNKRIMDDHFE